MGPTRVVTEEVKTHGALPSVRQIPVYDVYVCIVVLAAPLIVYGFLVNDVSVRLSRSLLIGSLPLLVLRFGTTPSLLGRDRFFLWCLLPYLCYTSITALWSQNVETGTTSSRLGGLYEVVIVYCLLVGADLHATRLVVFIKVYVASAILPVIVAFWQLANNVLHFSEAELPLAHLAIEGKYTEVVAGRYFVAAEGFSRLSGTFAEPVIFSSYLCSVLLLSFALRPIRRSAKIMLQLFQATLVVVIIFALSKLSILSCVVGVCWLALSNRRLVYWGVGLAIAFALIFAVLAHFGMGSIFDRLGNQTGHWERLAEDLSMFTFKSVTIGEGIGSIPYGSFHRVALSRVYESGIIGLIFVAELTLLPIAFMLLRVRNPHEAKLKQACIAALIAIILGLHIYDYFIHLFTWIVLGATLSFYNASSAAGIRGWTRDGTATRRPDNVISPLC